MDSSEKSAVENSADPDEMSHDAVIRFDVH